MSSISQSSGFDRNLMPRERHFGLPKLALRRRTADHPMVLFFVMALTAFAAMALVPPAGPALASLSVSFEAPARAGEVQTTAKGGRLHMSETDIACRGQAWGAESAACLQVIARESGRAAIRKIRVIADAQADTATPNVF